MAECNLFVSASEQAWVPAGEGVQRRMLGYSDGLMMAEVKFEKGAIGALHSHPHLQVSYVANGLFEMTIGGKVRTLGKGDSYMVPADVEHGARALQPGTLIDCFTPAREDFLGEARA